MADLTDYEKYIRTQELLALQKPAAELSCHDEMQFQVVHQVAELWMKLIGHEAHHAVELMQKDLLARASATFHRMGLVERLLTMQLEFLDTMAPKDYMTIRTVLGQGSGQESPGFKALLKLPGDKLWPAFRGVLERHGVTLRQVYEKHEEHFELYSLAEGLIDFDQHLQIWRHRHLMLVFRIIGAGTPSLKGKHSELLEQGMKHRFFPELWEVRDEVFGAWTAEMQAKGKVRGYHR